MGKIEDFSDAFDPFTAFLTVGGEQAVTDPLAELARIGRYYATESMLMLNPSTGRYDAAATPSTGRQTLGGFYAALARGDQALPERGDHAVF